jgi:hypothetical protein
MVRGTLFNRKAYVFAGFELGPVRLVGVVDLHAERLGVEVERPVKIRHKHSDETDFHGLLRMHRRMQSASNLGIPGLNGTAAIETRSAHWRYREGGLRRAAQDSKAIADLPIGVRGGLRHDGAEA